MPSLDDYLALVTVEHGDKPRFIASLSALLQPYVDAQALLAQVPTVNYDVDIAIGAQLDVIGQWVGISRQLKVPLQNSYFAWDTVGVGWDQGVWWKPGVAIEGVAVLDDDSYRLLIYAKIAANRWDGTMSGLQMVLGDMFAQTGVLVFIIDNFDMSITIGLAGKPASAVFQSLLLQNYVPFRPAAVALKHIVVGTADAPILGLGIETAYISGLGVGAWAQTVL